MYGLAMFTSKPLSDAPAASEVNIDSPDPRTRYFARQPILDRHKKVFGYEFLFRTGLENSFVVSSQSELDDVTRLMVDNSILYDFESLAARGKTFFNCTREALTGKLLTLLPRQSTVLEILENIEPDDEVVEACRSLREAGYQLALDDFVPRAGLERLLPYADYIKIDFRQSNIEARREIFRFVKGSPARLLAEKVETESEFLEAVDEGFDYFQGYFFCRPAILSRKRISANALNHIRLLTALSRSPLDWLEVEGLVRADVSLCYRLLRVVNSVEYISRGNISSIHNALITVGEDKFRKIATIAITAEIGKDQPLDLLILTLQHARFCELAAQPLHQNSTEQYLYGLFSLLPALLGTSMDELVALLPLRDPVKAALIGEPSSLSGALQCLRHYELGSHPDCSTCTSGAHLGPGEVARMYIESLKWAERAVDGNPV